MKTELEILNSKIDFSQDGIIDRQKAIEAMQEYAEQFKPKWISVEERLPEEEGFEFIIFGRYAADCPDRVMTAQFNFKKGYFHVKGVKSKNVTHWMPLPTKP